jgi:hypothetical protein
VSVLGTTLGMDIMSDGGGDGRFKGSESAMLMKLGC